MTRRKNLLDVGSQVGQRSVPNRVFGHSKKPTCGIGFNPAGIGPQHRETTPITDSVCAIPARAKLDVSLNFVRQCGKPVLLYIVKVDALPVSAPVVSAERESHAPVCTFTFQRLLGFMVGGELGQILGCVGCTPRGAIRVVRFLERFLSRLRN